MVSSHSSDPTRLSRSHLAAVRTNDRASGPRRCAQTHHTYRTNAAHKWRAAACRLAGVDLENGKGAQRHCAQYSEHPCDVRRGRRAMCFERCCDERRSLPLTWLLFLLPRGEITKAPVTNGNGCPCLSEAVQHSTTLCHPCSFWAAN